MAAAFSWNKLKPLLEMTSLGQAAMGKPPVALPQAGASVGVTSQALTGTAPALYYMQIYVTSPAQVAALDLVQIHWDSLPLFPAELSQYNDRQGIFDFLGDGAGTWVFAIVPGPVYNAILSEALAGTPVVAAILPRAVPDLTARNFDGSLNYQWLQAAGFEYRPQDVTAGGATTSASIFGFITKAVRFVAGIADGAVSLVRQGIGKIDQWLAGSAVVTMTFQINNTDPQFNTGVATTNAFQQAWGQDFGKPFKLSGGMSIKLRQTVLGIPSLATHLGTVDANGGATIHVAKNGTTNACLTLQSGAATMRSFLTPIEICGFDTHKVTASETRHVIIQHPYANIFAQLNDGRNYFNTVGGVLLDRAEVLVGPFANLLTINGRSFTPCFTHFNAGDGLLIDAATQIVAPAAAALSAGLLGTILGPLGGLLGGVATVTVVAADATLIPILEATDMVIANADQPSRLVTTHEYGHLALCSMLDKSGRFSVIYADIIKATLGSGGKPTASDESSYINEGWADFVASQVAGGVDYFSLAPRDFEDGQPAKDRSEYYCDPRSRECMDDNIGGPEYCPSGQGPGTSSIGSMSYFGCAIAHESTVAGNVPNPPFHVKVAFITTWLHDMVDHQVYITPSNDAGNGAVWEWNPTLKIFQLGPNTGFDSGHTSSGADNASARDEPVALGAYGLYQTIWSNFNRTDLNGKYVYGSLNEVHFINNLLGTIDASTSALPGQGCLVCRLHDPSGTCPDKYQPFTSCDAVPPPAIPPI